MPNTLKVATERNEKLWDLSMNDSDPILPLIPRHIRGYASLPETDVQTTPGRHWSYTARLESDGKAREVHSTPWPRCSLATVLALLCLLALLASKHICRTPEASYSFPSNFVVKDESWAAYNPYFPVHEYRTPPNGCQIDQVNIIQRHGARFPTLDAAARMVGALLKLQSAEEYLDHKLDFLRNYTYSLGTDDLVPFGALQSRQAGEEAYTRYKHLISEDDLPFVRAASSKRVVKSARKWTEGVSLASDHSYNPPLSLIISEAANCTLANKMCPNSGDPSEQTNTWAHIFGSPIAARLNAVAPGANLLPEDIPKLMPLCPFETVATEKRSPFCALFTHEEFQKYEYYMDLEKYYRTGYGAALGPVQGVGYVNELLARLTGTPVHDNTQTNRTLDSSPLTFPLNRSIYADFSHDNEMIAIYSALGLVKQPKPLDPTEPDPGRTWVMSHLVPFSGRMVTERLSCADSGTKYVRILVNDALQPLEFCGSGDGLCVLDAFVKSQSYARSDGAGDFQKCKPRVHDTSPVDL